MGQGKENVKLFLKDNPDLMEEIEYQFREHYDILTESDIEAHKKAERARKRAMKESEM